MNWQLEEPEQGKGAGLYINPPDVLGHLLIVWATDYLLHSPTAYSEPGKPDDAVIVDVVDLDQVDPASGQSGLLARGSFWRQYRLIQMLKPRVGNPNPVLIRISRAQRAYEWNSMIGDQPSMLRYRQWCEANPGFVPSPKRTQEEVAPARQQKAEVHYRPGGSAAGGALPQVQETPLERDARLAQGQPPTSIVLEKLRAMGGINHQDQPQSELPPY